MTDLPAPLVPAEVDLRGLPFMPLDVVRLLDSDLFALSDGFEFKAAVALWCKCWLQVPAASLPADDRVLAHLSGAGARWKKVKAMALRGFVTCADGRLYHPVIAEKAIEAWGRRQAQRARANRRWQGGGQDGGGSAGGGGGGTAGGAAAALPGHRIPDAASMPGHQKPDATAYPPAGATAMQGTGTGTGKVSDSSSSSGAEPGMEEDGLPALDLPNSIIRDFDRSRAAVFGDGAARPWPNHLDRPVAEQWVAGGADLAFCRAVFDAVNRRLLARGHEPRKMLKGMDEDMRAALAERDRAPDAARVGASVVPIRREVDADALAAELARLGALEEGAA